MVSTKSSREKGRQSIAERISERKATLIVAVVFILAACFLIAFAPSYQSQATTIIAVGLLVIGVGLAGFTVFRLSMPGILVDMRREERQPPPGQSGTGKVNDGD